MNKLKTASVTLLIFATVGTGEWKFTSSLSVKETYDDNVFLQDRGALANKSSMVTTITPALNLSFQEKASNNKTFSLIYSAEINEFHSEHGEDFVSHNLGLNFKYQVDAAILDIQNTLTHIDGTDRSLTFTAPGAAPAMGGVAMRDRRDADILKTNYSFTVKKEWLLRYRLTSYVHNFHTEQDPTPGYENYVDRAEVSGGLDLGPKIANETYAFLGYRFGWQHQSTIFDSPIVYSNHYQRLLIGVEGQPAKWVKFNFTAGPDVRDFYGQQIADFDTNQVCLFIDASATFILSSGDEINLISKRFMQPNYCGRAVYEDITYQASYKHKFDDHLSSETLLRVYSGDWGTSSSRDDRIYTASINLNYKYDDHLSMDLGYSYDLGESNVPDTDGREFHRNAVYLSGRYQF